jgi:hypothetical protein
VDALPSLPNLTPDDRAWRLDWFGECAYPGSVRRYAQPSIKVVLSSLRGDPADHSALLSPDSTDHQHPYEAWAPIAALPMLAIGDLWQHGRQIASPDYQIESFKGVAINHDTVSFVKAGLAIDEHFLLPLSSHPWHRLHTQSYCVAVELDSRRRLLVPCVELIRFYFGSSSNFLQRLFTVPLAPENLWSSKRFNPATRHLHLVLANKLSGLSASDIGRIAESKFAWRAAAGIHASCQKASALMHAVYPYTGFPFEGSTDLVASGVWLPFGEQEHATFLVYRLRSCAHPFPFQSLSYEAGDRKALHSSSGEAREGAKKFLHRRDPSQKSESAATDADAGKSQRRAVFVSHRRFPDLVRKQVWREKIEAMPNADVFLRHTDGSLEQVAFGESTWSSTTPGIGVSPVDAGTPPQRNVPLPWFVPTGLKAIESAPGYDSSETQIKIVCPAGRQTPVFCLPVVINEDGEIASELLFTGLDGRTRQRRACFVEITCNGPNCRYMLILEGRAASVRPEIVAAKSAEMACALELAMPDLP